MEIDLGVKEIDMGVTSDKNLSVDTRVTNTIIINCMNKANRIIGIIKRSFTFINKVTFLHLYKALDRPILEYGNTVRYTTKIKHMPKNPNKTDL